MSARRSACVFIGAVAVLMLPHAIRADVMGVSTDNRARYDAIGIISMAELKPSPSGRRDNLYLGYIALAE